MAFPKNGVVEAPKIVPSAFGLLAVVPPQNSADEDMWVRGFSQEFETELYTAKNTDDTNTTSFDVVALTTPSANYFDVIKPWFIEVDNIISGLGFRGLDRFARVSRQLEGITQDAMEKELWDGAIRKGRSHENRALSSSTATLVNSGTAVSAKLALAYLEQKIGEVSEAGEQGIIHMTRDVAAVLSSNSQMLFHSKNGDHLQTMGGTPVIVGSGYSGNGPTGDANATATLDNKWMYATGTIRTYVGNIDVVNDNLAQAYNVSGNNNTMRLKAIRPAAVYFDPSIHLAVRVNLLAT